MPNTLPVIQLDGQLPTIRLDGQLPTLKLDKAISVGEAAGKGYLESALGMSQSLGELFGVPGASAETVTTAQQQAELAAAQRPIATGIGNLAPKMIGALPAIPVGGAVSALGAPTVASGVMGGLVGGLPAAGADYETKFAEIFRKTGDKNLAEQMALTAGGTTALGFALPGGIGTTILPKVLTGVGLNVPLGEAEVAIQNKLAADAGHPELQQELWDPTRMGLNAAMGGVAGFIGSTPAKAFTPSGIREEFHNFQQAKAQAMGKPMSAEETRLFHVENRSLEETNKLIYHEKSLQKAEEAHKAALASGITDDINTASERLAAAQQRVDETKAVITSSESDYKNLSGTAYKTPKQRFEAYVKEAAEAGSTALLRRAEAFGNYHLKHDPSVGAAVKDVGVELKSRAGQSGRLGPDERRANTLLDNINFTSSEEAHASIRNLIRDGEMSLDDVDKLIARNATLLEKVQGLDTKGKLKKLLQKEQELLQTAKRDISLGKKAPPITGKTWQTHRPTANLTIHNASKEEAELVKRMVHSLGLTGEKIDINMRNASSNMGVPFNQFYGNITEHQARLLNPANITWFQRLNGADIERFHRAWHIGHELGHALMYRLMRNDLYTEDLKKLNKAYLSYLERNPIAAKEGAYGNPLFQQRIVEAGNEEYMSRFAEYFAQRVAREMLNPTSTTIGTFVKRISRIWSELAKDLPLGSKHDNLVDTFLQDLIQKNRDELLNTGKTIFEVTSTSRSLEEAARLTLEMSPIPADYNRPNIARSPFDEASSAVAALKTDINPTNGEIGTVLAQIQDTVPLLNKGELYNNPVISFLVTKIWNAYQNKTRMQGDILGADYTPNARRSIFTSTKRQFNDKSFHTLAEQSTPRDFYEVMLVFERGSGRLDYESNLYKNGIHLTDKQKDLYRSISKVFKDTLAEQNAHQSKLDRALIPQKLGYIPSIRKGDFAAVVSSTTPITKGFTFDEMGNRVLETTPTVHMERFHTAQERDAWIVKWKKLNKVGETVSILNRVPEVGVEHMELVRAMRDTAVLSGVDPATIARMDALLGEMSRTDGKIGGHHKRQLGFIQGGMGTGLFRDQHQQGLDFKSSVVEYVGEISNIIEKQSVALHADSLLLLLNKDTHSNLINVVEGMREYAVGGQERLLGKGVKELVDSITTSFVNFPLKKFGKEWYPQQHVWDTVLGKVTHAFYIKHLMSSVRFATSQLTVFGISMRSLVKDQSATDALIDMNKGFARLLKGDKDLFNFIEYAVRNSGSFHPSFIQDLTKHGFFENLDKRNKLLFSILSGEFVSTSADSFSRLMTASFAFEHFIKKGYQGQDLYDQVLRLTDKNMILYSKTFKAPILDKTGVIGELVGPLSTYPLSQTWNLLSDMRYIKDKRKALGLYQSMLPLLVTMGMSAAIGGLRGMALVAEIEMMLQLVNFAIRSLSEDEDPYQLPTLWDWYMGSPTGNKVVDTTLSHGLVSSATLAFSEEGYDLGASNAWKQLISEVITGDKAAHTAIPVGSWATTVAADTIKIAGTEYPTEGQRRSLLKQTMPQWAFGLVDAGYFDSFKPGVQQVSSGDSKLNKSFERGIARILGANTIDEQKEMARQFRYKQLTMEERRKANDIITQMSSGDMPDEVLHKNMRILITKYHMSPEEVITALENKAIKSGISTESAPMGKSDADPTDRELAIYQQVFRGNK